MNQGISVDYAIVSPAHMSTFAKAAPFIDAPFVFRDHDQMNKVIAQDVLKPICRRNRAEGRRAAGRLTAAAACATSSPTSRSTTWPRFKGLKVRVQGAPIWTRTFAAAGMAPTVIAYNEIYNGSRPA